MVAYIVAWALVAGLGYFIGTRKGRPAAGLLLGLFLGLIGIVIIAVIPATDPSHGAVVKASGYGPSGGQWAPDPSGSHELRWFDGTRWTDHVTDAGVPSLDPVPAHVRADDHTESAPLL